MSPNPARENPDYLSSNSLWQPIPETEQSKVSGGLTLLAMPKTKFSIGKSGIRYPVIVRFD